MSRINPEPEQDENRYGRLWVCPLPECVSAGELREQPADTKADFQKHLSMAHTMTELINFLIAHVDWQRTYRLIPESAPIRTVN